MKRKVIYTLILSAVILGVFSYNMLNEKEVEQNTSPTIKQISTEELALKMQQKDENVIYIDVRESYEYEEGHIKGMINMPLSSLDQSYVKLNKNAEIVLICRSGNRSMQAANKLKNYGFTNLVNVQGGISNWTGKIIK
jgi:rhodanese-related sulfurtransferase